MKISRLILLILLLQPLGLINARHGGSSHGSGRSFHRGGHASRVGMRPAHGWHGERGYGRHSRGWGRRGRWYGGGSWGRRRPFFGLGAPFYADPYYYDYGIYGGPGFGLNLYI